MFLRVLNKTKPHLRKSKRANRNLMTWKEANHQGLLNASAQEYMDKDGNTPLHYSLIHFRKISELKEMILSYGENDISIMSRTVNNQGGLPYDGLVHENSNMPPSEKDEACSILEKLMTKNDLIKRLSDPIDIDVIMERYRDLDVSVKNNLISGCETLNETRKIIKDSYTHPQANNYTLQQQDELNKLIFEIRSTYPPNYFARVPGTNYVFLLTEKIKKFKVGNCFEYSLVSLHNVTEKNKLAYGSVFGVEKDDHVFPVFDTYRTVDCQIKINTGVVIDAMNCEVFPTDEIPFRLNTFEVRKSVRNGGWFRIISSLNLNYHGFVNHSSVNGDVSLPDFKKQETFSENDKLNNNLVFFKKEPVSSVNEKSEPRINRFPPARK